MKLLEIFLLFCDNSDALRLLSSENNRDLPNHYCEDHAPCFNLIKGRFPVPWGVRSAKKWLFHTPSACGGVVGYSGRFFERDYKPFGAYNFRFEPFV